MVIVMLLSVTELQVRWLVVDEADRMMESIGQVILYPFHHSHQGRHLPLHYHLHCHHSTTLTHIGYGAIARAAARASERA